MKPRSGQLNVAEDFLCHPAEIELTILQVHQAQDL